MHSDPTRRFAELATLPDSEIDIAEGALLIAAERVPDLDVHGYLERLDALATGLEPGLSRAGSGVDRVEALNRGFFDELGFRGNQDDYEDPRNSFLNEVLDRRTGIPITLAIVYVEVARRLGLDAEGVGFPGHFLAKVNGVPTPDGNDEVVVDAFFGRVLDLRECQERLRQALGPGAQLGPDSLRAASTREILTRVLTNLKNHHLRRGEPLDALSCIDRILMLWPSAALEYRDRGLINDHLGFGEPARADLERFLELAPTHESARAVRLTLERIGRVRTLVH
ncbi:MAG: tetratricopeptide repeat protein [Actinomycetota bacterium]|nr:tetratricopeptide repeat protein [Actinomycetota bacterium]